MPGMRARISEQRVSRASCAGSSFGPDKTLNRNLVQGNVPEQNPVQGFVSGPKSDDSMAVQEHFP